MFLRKVLGKIQREETSSSSSLSTSGIQPVCNVVLIEEYRKTDLFNAFCGEDSKGYPDIVSQPGVYFEEKEFKMHNGTIALNIWKINEEKGHKEIPFQYCRGAHGILLCYDQSDSRSFDRIESFARGNESLLPELNVSIHIVCVSKEKKNPGEPKVSQKEVKSVAKSIDAKISCCYLDDIRSINGVFRSLVADITKKCNIKFKIPSDLPPKPLIQGDEDKDKESPVSLVSLCRYKYAEIGARKEVKRNEDGLFGNYHNHNNWLRFLYYRVSVLGNPRIGKSCLCARYLEGECNKRSESDRLWVRSFSLPNRIFLRLRMCEGPLPQGGADEREDKEHFSRSHAVLLCYDITDRASFEAVAAVAAGVRADAMRGAVMMVVGLKYDDEGHVKVSGEEGRSLADANGMTFRECSAADNVGVWEVFTTILSELQQADLFALPINSDYAKRTLKPSVLPSGTTEYKENPRLASLLRSIITENGREIKEKDSYERDYDYLFKIVLRGDSGVGKSCLLLRYADDTYTDMHMSTIGVDFKIKTTRTPDNTIVKLQIWDPNKRSSNPSYRGAHAIILCFDTTNRESFDNLKQWLVDVDRFAPENTVVVIVGTKSDLPPVVDPAAARKYAESLGFPLLYCSSKACDGVDEVFNDAVLSIGYKRGYEFGLDLE